MLSGRTHYQDDRSLLSCAGRSRIVQGLQAAHEAEMAAERVGSPIDRMHAQTNAMQAQLDAMKALQPATEALYKALTADQQDKANVVLLLLGSTGGGVSFEH
jgi:putative heme degradation protein